MDYLKKIHSSVAAQVHSVAAQVNLALPGNPIFREYTVGQQIASAGPGLCWKIYSSTKNSTKQEVAVWLFEKKQTENWLKVRKDELPEMLKKGVNQLTRLRHPRILTVERALEESRDCFAFCTEPIFASLANCFGDLDNFSSPPRLLKEFQLLDVEIRHGLFQLSEALAFLHNDTKTVHGNLSPSSVLINSKGAWKLAGFDFQILGNTSTPGKVTFEVPGWSLNSMSALCPDLNYIAPELIEGTKCDTFSDIFSLGMLAFATFNNGKPLFESQNSFACYKKSAEKLKQSLPNTLKIVPESFREDIKMCLNETPEFRPDAIQFTKLTFFEHPLLKTLNFLDTRSAMDNTQKMQFFKGLPNILTQFPKRALLQKVYPHLAAEFSTVVLVPFVLPSVFLIAESANTEEFVESVMPSLVTVFPVQTPYQITLLLLQKVGLWLDKMPAPAIKQHLLPLMYNSLTSESPKIQELCLLELPNVIKFVDREQMRGQLLPKLLRLVLECREIMIRVKAMVCLAKLLPHLEPWMVSDQLLPALPKVSSKDPGVLMAVLGIYKMVFENEKFGINKEQCAKSVLPFLISTCIEPTLNLDQFNQFAQLVHKLLDKVEKEQRQSLQHLSASQEEQRRITDFADFLNNGDSKSQQLDAVDLGDLAKMMGANDASSTDARSGSPASSSNGGSKNGKHQGTMTLEEKRRIVAEKEQQKKNSSQQREATGAGNNGLGGRQQSNNLDWDAEFAGCFDSRTTGKLQRPSSSQQMTSAHSSAISPANQMDLLSEFLPSPTTTKKHHPSAQQQTHTLGQSASFSSFPSLPQPNISSNPVNRKTTANDDPILSLLEDLKPVGAQQNKEKTVGTMRSKNSGNRDPFDDLLG